jgi:hypothetical protein
MTEPLFEFDEARRLIKEGAKAYFRELREKRPEQVIYTYAITGSEDAPALGLAANSEQGYEKVLAGYRDDTSFRETLKEMGLEFSPFDYRWRFPEWVFGGGAQHMGPVSDILEAVELEKEDPGPETDVEFKDQVYAAMVLGLRDLDAEDLFGTGADRQKINLLCSLSDSADCAWLEHRYAHLLNLLEVFDRFYAQWITNSAMAEDLAKNRDQPSSVCKAFEAALSRANGS